MTHTHSPGKYGSISAQIRELDRQGVPRAEIARRLNKRYQHVRNVLEADRQRLPKVAEASPARGSDEALEHFRLVVEPGGIVRLPPEVLERFGVGEGRVVMGRLKGDAFTLVSGTTALREAQALVRKAIPAGLMLSDELIADRRREVEAEFGG